MKTLLGIADQMLGRKTLPCTACHYCVSHCPKELDIPTLLNLYNEHCFTEGGFIAPMALSSYPDDGGFRRKTCNVRKELDYEHSTRRKYGRRKRPCNH